MALVVPLSQQVVKVLRQHRETLQCLGLHTKDGLVFVTPRTYEHLFDSGFVEGLEALSAACGNTSKAFLCPASYVPELCSGNWE